MKVCRAGEITFGITVVFSTVWFLSVPAAMAKPKDVTLDYRDVSFGVTTEQRALEKPIVAELFSALEDWAGSPSQDKATRCQSLAMKLIQTGDPSTDAYYHSARVLELIGKPELAIQALTEISQKRPDGISPGNLTTYVRRTANFWRGRLAYNLGEYDQAIEAFRNVRIPPNEDPGYSLAALISISYELQAVSAKSNGVLGGALISEDALRQEYAAPAEQRSKESGEMCSMMIDWMVKTGLVQGVGPTKSATVSPVKGSELGMVLYGRLLGVGISLDTSDEAVKSWKGKNITEKGVNILSKYLEQSRNKYDRVVLLFALAKSRLRLCDTEEFAASNQQTANLAAAISDYRTVIAEDSFFAPWAQLGIAECLARMGKKDDALKELDKIASTWPTHAAVVAETKTAIDKPEGPQSTSESPATVPAVPGPHGPG